MAERSKRGQFLPGQSGNTKGRPRGPESSAGAIKRALDTKIPITENGRGKRITKRDAAATQLANKAAQGDLNAAKWALDQDAKQQVAVGAAPAEISASDDEIVRRFLIRYGAPLPERDDETR